MKQFLSLFLISVAVFLQGPGGKTGVGGKAGIGGGSTLITFNASQHYVASCATATTCGVVATNGVAAGDTLGIFARTISPVKISSIDVGGTTVDAYFRSGTASNRGNLVGAYVLSASSVGSGNTITVTFSGTTGGAKVEIMTGTPVGGSAALDAVADTAANSGVSSPFAGPAITLTGTKDFVMVAGQAFNGSSSTNVTAVDGSWTNTNFSTAGFANQGNVTSVTTPNWTATTPTIKATAGMAFGINSTACTNAAMIDFSGGTAGNAPTAATMESSTFGATGNSNPSITGGDPHSWSVVTPSTFLTFNASAHKALNSAAPRFCDGGATYSDSGSLGLQLDTTGTGTTRYVQLEVPYGTSFPGFGASATASLTCWFRTSLAGADTVNMDVFTLIGSSGGNSTANAYIHTTGSLIVGLEGSADATVTISANTWYQLQILWKQGAANHHTLRVLDSSGNQVGSDQTLSGLDNSWPDHLVVGDSNGSAVTTGKTVWWDKVQFCFLGTCTFITQ